MKFIGICVLAMALGFAGAQQSAAQSTPSQRDGQRDDERCGPLPPRPAGFERGREVFSDGELHASDCAREWIESARSYDDIQDALWAMRYFYSARARRQQTMMDYGAGAVVIGTLGYASSGRVGTATQNAWGYAALFTVLAAEWNSLEPTRALFDAGYAGLGLIDARYGRLRELSYRLQAHVSALGEPNCHSAEWTPDLSAWTQPVPAARGVTDAQRVAAQAARTTDLEMTTTELRRLQTLCFSMASAHAQVLLVADPRLQEAAWVRAYQTDLRALDRMLQVRDAELRHSPIEILESFRRVASRTIDTILTGGEGSAAVTTVQIQSAVSGLAMPVAAVDQLSVQTLPAEAISASAALLTRSSSSANSGLRVQAATLTRQAMALESQRQHLLAARAIVEEMRALSAARRLHFTWNLEARAPEGRLEVQTAPTPAAA